MHPVKRYDRVGPTKRRAPVSFVVISPAFLPVAPSPPLPLWASNLRLPTTAFTHFHPSIRHPAILNSQNKQFIYIYNQVK